MQRSLNRLGGSGQIAQIGAGGFKITDAILEIGHRNADTRLARFQTGVNPVKRVLGTLYIYRCVERARDTQNIAML